LFLHIQIADEAQLFDGILDCVGEAGRSTKLLRENGGIVSIATAPTVEALRTWVQQSHIDASQITIGVKYGMLLSTANC
jgi:hypothetical protein